jgi:hypothetical protein
LESYFEKQEKLSKAEKEKSKKEMQDAAQGRLDVRKVLSMPEGQRLLFEIIKFSGVWSSPMKTSSEIYYLTGRADVGRFILDKLQKVSPSDYLKIMSMKVEQENENDN